MRELLDQPHVATDKSLNRRHREKARVQFAILLAGITPDIVEVHPRQTAVARLDVHFEILVTDGSEGPTTVVHNVITAAVTFAQ